MQEENSCGESKGRCEAREDLSTSPANDLASYIRALLSEKLLVEVESPEADLLKSGILDSLTLVQLLLHLEEHFGLKLVMDELDIEDFRSIDSIARLVSSQSKAVGA